MHVHSVEKYTSVTDRTIIWHLLRISCISAKYRQCFSHHASPSFENDINEEPHQVLT